MKLHDIVSARLPITSVDIGSTGTLPPRRLTPSSLEQRVLEQLSDRVDLFALFHEICQTQVMAENAKQAAEQAIGTLSRQISAAWQTSTGSTIDLVRDHVVYRMLPNGQHETIGYMMQTAPGGTPLPVSVDVKEGGDVYRCFVHVSLSAREAAAMPVDSSSKA